MIDRIIAEHHKRGERQLLVKWRGLEYGRATWEREEDLENDADAIERYVQRKDDTQTAVVEKPAAIERYVQRKDNIQTAVVQKPAARDGRADP